MDLLGKREAVDRKVTNIGVVICEFKPVQG